MVPVVITASQSSMILACKLLLFQLLIFFVRFLFILIRLPFLTLLLLLLFFSTLGGPSSMLELLFVLIVVSLSWFIRLLLLFPGLVLGVGIKIGFIIVALLLQLTFFV